MSQYIVKFPLLGRVHLSSSEKKLISKLIEAAEAIAHIYEQQVSISSRAQFYPTDASKNEILSAARQNSRILSPYTIVERTKAGKLKAVPYHIKYKKDLEKVAKLIQEAALISDNKEFSNRLIAQASALLDGNYQACDIHWSSPTPYKISFVIGPIERYDDKLFFTKCAYQSWLGILNEDETKQATLFKDYIVSARRKVLVPSEKVDFLEKIQVRVDHTLVFAGLIARFMFTSSNLPNDVNLMEKYGSEVTIFGPSFNQKFEKERYPIAKSVFKENFLKTYSKSLLREGSIRNSYLHEICHPLLRYRDSEQRLKELFPIFDELTASILGVKACGSLLLKNVITQDELESIMVMFIALAFSWWLSYLQEPTVVHYAQGFAIALNFFLESGAIRESGGFSWPNFTKLFVSIVELESTLERILAIGTYDDAAAFVEKYASLNIFERFHNNLKKIA